jgi:hypothetical protein
MDRKYCSDYLLVIILYVEGFSEGKLWVVKKTQTIKKGKFTSPFNSKIYFAYSARDLI